MAMKEETITNVLPTEVTTVQQDPARDQPSEVQLFLPSTSGLQRQADHGQESIRPHTELQSPLQVSPIKNLDRRNTVRKVIRSKIPLPTQWASRAPNYIALKEENITIDQQRCAAVQTDEAEQISIVSESPVDEGSPQMSQASNTSPLLHLSTSPVPGGQEDQQRNFDGRRTRGATTESETPSTPSRCFRLSR